MCGVGVGVGFVETLVTRQMTMGMTVLVNVCDRTLPTQVYFPKVAVLGEQSLKAGGTEVPGWFIEGTECADVPMFPLPKNRPALVEDDGGGGFWICDAVGARDWRIEYVLEAEQASQ